MGRFTAQLYLHIASGAWQWPIADSATVELRDVVTKMTVAELPVALVIAALVHYVGQAALTRELLPRGPELRAGRGPGPHDTGHPRLRGAENRRLRGRKRPQELS